MFLRFASSSTSFPEHQIITMPALSPTMTTGNLASWAKKEGDSVTAGDVLAEIETDKAVMEFEASEDGYLAKILVAEGAKDVQVGNKICVIVPDADSVKAFKDAKESDFADSNNGQSAPELEKTKEPVSMPSKETATSATKDYSAPAEGVKSDREGASPLAKSIAKSLGINLSDVKKDASGAPINKDSILSHAKQLMSKSPDSSQPIATSISNNMGSAQYEDIPNSSVRKVIANRLTESKSTIPHYYLTAECNIDLVMNLRESINKTAEKEKDSFKLSVNDFVMKASACACRDVPQVNSAWMGDFIRQYKNVDISVAVDTGNGLITPIVTNVNHKGLKEISQAVKELAGRAKINKLKPNEYQGGTFTVSNLGMYGISSFTAIINPPQSCILAVGAGEKKVILDARNNYTLATVMKVTLSCDHRSVDGAVGAKWLQAFKKYIENPQSMIL